MSSSGVMSLTCPSVCACVRVCIRVCLHTGMPLEAFSGCQILPFSAGSKNAVSKDLRKEPQVTVRRLSNFLSVKIFPVILIVVRGSRPRNPLLPAPTVSLRPWTELMTIVHVTGGVRVINWWVTVVICWLWWSPENVVVDVKYYCDVSHILIFHVTP